MEPLWQNDIDLDALSKIYIAEYASQAAVVSELPQYRSAGLALLALSIR